MASSIRPTRVSRRNRRFRPLAVAVPLVDPARASSPGRGATDQWPQEAGDASDFSAAIEKLTGTAGFHYVRDAANDQFAHAAAMVDPDRSTGDPAAVVNVATSVAGSPAVTSHRRNPGRDATDEVISAPSRWG